MSRARAIRPLIALGLALGLALPAAAPAAAADPPAYRPDRPAWDRQPTPSDTAGAADGTRLIVRFRPGTTAMQRRASTAPPGLTRVADLPASHLAVVNVTADGAATTIKMLEADPNVVDVSIDHRRYRDDDPTAEQAWTELWGLHNRGQRLLQGRVGTAGKSNVDIDGLQALGVNQGDPSVVVAVIDDGVDFSHPDLAARAWSNPGESGGGKETNGVDDDGNGYVDDVHGWDFCHDDNTTHDFDDDFHGTHVAGTIAASLDGAGVVGVAPGIKIMGLKFINGTKACGFDSMAIEAIAYAKSFGIHISNNSWGGRGPRSSAPELRNAIANSGMLFVTSAGNTNPSGINNDTNKTPSLPASWDLPNILSVAAVTNLGKLASFSNYGRKSVDIVAPGATILSSLPADSGDPTPGWGWLSGTSMAAPHVAGTAALVISSTPSLAGDPVALKARLLGSGKAMPSTAGKTVTGRIIDAFLALDAVPPTSPAPTGAGFAQGSILSKTAVSGRATWAKGTDDLTGVASYRVGVQVDGGSWKSLTSSTKQHSIASSMTFGRAYAFRVRARDGAGNWGQYVTGPTVKASRYQEATSLATYKGKWSTSRSGSWSGGKTKYSRSAGANVTFSFTGRAFAIVAPKGPTRGKVKLYVDGAFVSTVDLHRSASLARVLVATRTWSASAAHTVKLVVVGTKGHPRVDVDAFLVMR